MTTDDIKMKWMDTNVLCTFNQPSSKQDEIYS